MTTYPLPALPSDNVGAREGEDSGFGKGEVRCFFLFFLLFFCCGCWYGTDRYYGGMEVYVCLRACRVPVVEYCVVSYPRNRLVPGRVCVVEGCAV